MCNLFSKLIMVMMVLWPLSGCDKTTAAGSSPVGKNADPASSPVGPADGGTSTTTTTTTTTSAATSATEAERLERERIERARLETERLERERIERARLEAERLERERIERERLEAERLERERIERARLEAERIERERLEAQNLKSEQIITALKNDLNSKTINVENILKSKGIYDFTGIKTVINDVVNKQAKYFEFHVKNYSSGNSEKKYFEDRLKEVQQAIKFEIDNKSILANYNELTSKAQESYSALYNKVKQAVDDGKFLTKGESGIPNSSKQITWLSKTSSFGYKSGNAETIYPGISSIKKDLKTESVVYWNANIEPLNAEYEKQQVAVNAEHLKLANLPNYDGWHSLRLISAQSLEQLKSTEQDRLQKLAEIGKVKSDLDSAVQAFEEAVRQKLSK